MASQLVDISVKAPKSLVDVGNILVTVAKGLKAKEPMAQLLSETLPAALAAAGDLSDLAADVKTPEAKQYIGVLLGQLAEALIA